MKKQVLAAVLCGCMIILGMGGCGKASGQDESVKQIDTTEEDTADNEEVETENSSDKMEEEDIAEKESKTQASLSVYGNLSWGNIGMAKREDKAVVYFPTKTYSDPEPRCVFYEGAMGNSPSEVYSLEGDVRNALLDDDNAYFVMDDCLYQYTYGETEQLLLSDVTSGELIGEIDGKVYYKYMGPEMDVATTRLSYYDIASGEHQDIQADDLQGNVDTLIGGNHFFYIGGRTDISAKPLYEVNPDSYEVDKIDDYVVKMVYDERGNLYYTAAESADPYSGLITVKKYDVVTKEVSELFSEAASELGSLVMANWRGIFFQKDDGTLTEFLCWNLEEEKLESIKSGTDVMYVPSCEGNIFRYTWYQYDSDGEIESSELYTYVGNDVNDQNDVANGFDLTANEVYGDILIAADQCMLIYQITSSTIHCSIESFHTTFYG